MSSTSSPPQPRPRHVSVLLYSLLAAEKERTRKWLRDEMDRLVEPMLDSLFERLTNKLIMNTELDNSEDGGYRSLNPSNHIETSFANIQPQHQPSTSAILPSTSTFYSDTFPQHSIVYEYENPEILAPVKQEFKEEVFDNDGEMMDIKEEDEEVEDGCGDGYPQQVPNPSDNFESPNPQMHQQPTTFNVQPSTSASTFSTFNPTTNQQQQHSIDDKVLEYEPEIIEVDDDDEESRPFVDSTGNEPTIPQVMDQIVQVQHRELSDLEYELQMLRSVFIKSIGGGGQFGVQYFCDYPECDKRFQQNEQLQQQLEKHLKQHTKPFYCAFVGCGKRFTTANAFTEHKKWHKSANVLQCNLVAGCVKRFRNNDALMQHKRDHTDAFICEWGECDKVFNTSRGQRSHHLTHLDDGIDPQQLECQWAGCGRKFTTQFNLSIHHQLHTGQSPLIFVPQPGPFACDRCAVSFTQKALLETHRLTAHTEQRQFKCTKPECGQAFASSALLEAHLRAHRLLSTFSQCGQSQAFDSFLLKKHGQK